MAEGRFISRNIAFSEQLGSVSFEADYLFTRILPHLDCEGRLTGSAKSIKARCVPLRDEMTEHVILTSLAELDQAGLIVWYEVDGVDCIEYPKFEKHQMGLRKNREQASKVPASSSLGAKLIRSKSGTAPESVRSQSGVSPRRSRRPPDIVSEVKLSEVKGSEEKLSTTSADGGDADASASDLHAVADVAWVGDPPDPNRWPKSWAFDTQQALAAAGTIIAVGVVGQQAKPAKDTMPWDEWLRVIPRMAADPALGKFGLPAALRRLGEFRDSAQLIGVGGNEAEIAQWIADNPPGRAASGAGR